ncbi:hypothetical protein PHMEG_00025191 [Phytophthora megakarya]|uniref:Uncharacterized protein n=1 Tax=Phytophthora megakarya TaxID=4795 RepID=A0A225VCR5_9STRA|nr:hypothetical protein PHMEG_00025191 [Phytophthora megakarya]
MNRSSKFLREILFLPTTDFETGQVHTLFGSVVQANDVSKSLKRLKNKLNNKWLGSVEVHQMITQENPGLLRTGTLTNAGGRYCKELRVTGGCPNSVSERLFTVSGAKIDSFLREKCSNDELVVVACLRADGRQSRAAESMLEQIQLVLFQQNQNSSGQQQQRSEIEPELFIFATTIKFYYRSKCRLVTESPALAERYRILAVPTFLMFYNSRLVNVSSLGGLALRVAPTPKNPHLSGQMDHLPRVLLWDLASSGEQTVFNFACHTGPDTEVRAIDRFVGPKERTKRKTGRKMLVYVVISGPG